MGAQPKIFKKNIIDLDSDNVTITVSDDEATNNGDSFKNKIRNRDNVSGWATTGSSDTATCYMEIDWLDPTEVESIILVGHNFKNYTVKRWNGSAFEDFDTPINPTTSTDFVTEHEVPSQNLSKIRIDINSTQIANDDKKLRQLIITSKIGNGQFTGWPEIRKFQRNQSRKGAQSLSGKYHLREQVGAFEYELRFKVWPYDADFSMIESIYFEHPKGFLFWACGGNSTQFRYERIGFRKQDIFLMKPLGEYDPVFEGGIYKNGVNFNLKLVETI